MVLIGSFLGNDCLYENPEPRVVPATLGFYQIN
jgi:hypothetical protein